MAQSAHPHLPDVDVRPGGLTAAGAWLVAVLGALLAAALALQLVPGSWVPKADTPGMAHYGQLMMATGRNLLVFMFVVFFFAYSYVLTGVRAVFGLAGLLPPTGPRLAAWNRAAGVAFGWFMVAVVAYLSVHLVAPVTAAHGWRGPLDVFSMACYLLVVVPAGLFALMAVGAVRETGWRVLGGTVALVVLAHAAMLGMWPLLTGFAGHGGH